MGIQTSKEQDEIGRMALAINRMTSSLQEMAVAAAKIARGDLTVQVEPRSPKDKLGQAFEQMVDFSRSISYSCSGIGEKRKSRGRSTHNRK